MLKFFSIPLVCFLLLSCNYEDVTNQPDKGGRIYGPVELISKAPIDYSASDMIVGNEHIYILDRRKQVVMVYNTDLEFLKKIGKKGPGPDEFSGVVSIYPTADKNIIAYDANKSTIKVVSAESGELVDFYKVPFKFERGMAINDWGESFVQGTASGFYLNFSKITKKGDEWGVIEDLPIDTIFSGFEGSSIRDDGFFASDGRASFYYVSYLSVNSYKFNAKGTVEARGKAVHDIIPPEVILEGNFAAPGNSEIYVMAVAADEEHLYVLNRLADVNNNLVVDCYDSDGLNYEMSFSLPYMDEQKLESVDRIAISDGRVFAATENFLLEMKFDF